MIGGVKRAAALASELPPELHLEFVSLAEAWEALDWHEHLRSEGELVERLEVHETDHVAGGRARRRRDGDRAAHAQRL